MTDVHMPGSQLGELVRLNRRFGVLYAGGVPIFDALVVLQGEAQLPFAAAIGEIRVRMEQGAGMASAMAEYPHLFPPIYREWVRQAEESGTLDIGAREAAELLEPVALAGSEAALGWDRIEHAMTLIQFTRRCAELLERGLEWWRVLCLLTFEAPVTFARLIEDLLHRRDDQRQWLALWERMEEYPQTFSPFYRAMIRLGWETRHFDETVHYLAELLYEDWRFAQLRHCFPDRPSLIIDLGQPQLVEWAALTPTQADLITLLFFRALSMLLAAGHDQAEALTVCANLLPQQQQTDLLAALGDEDRSLADLLPFFSPFVHALLRVGEQRGRSEYVCNQIAEVLRAEQHFTDSV